MTTITKAAITTARALARAFGHGWATCPLGPTDAEIIADVDAAMGAWTARVIADDARLDAEAYADALARGDEDAAEWTREHPRDGTNWMGLGPSTTHVSGSGTVAWTVAPNGTARVTVRCARRCYDPETGEYRDPPASEWRLEGRPGERFATTMVGPAFALDSHERTCAIFALRAMGLTPQHAEVVMDHPLHVKPAPAVGGAR
jgi:hypothetical protein